MRKTTSPADAAPADSAIAMPTAGGSYVRQPDGSLTRVEFTDEPSIAEEPAAEAPAGGETDTTGQEG